MGNAPASLRRGRRDRLGTARRPDRRAGRQRRGRIYAHGTAGEFHALEEDEFDQVNTLLAERCKAAGLQFQIGGLHPAVAVMLGRVRRAAALEPGTIQMIPAGLGVAQRRRGDPLPHRRR
ncbi:hypothetical protein GCM10020220_030280 [Nonomuraea rubra]|uniref:hypothetical protein n=1 Tax=Nonomuraea rubra TaxID=46180 RepID=UPI0031ECBB04